MEESTQDKPSKEDANKKVMELVTGAAMGSLKELEILAKFWTDFPSPLKEHIHGVFLLHLNSSEVPTEPRLNVVGTTKFVEEERAFWSLWGLAKLEPLESDGQEFVDAWPGIFKWSAFFFASRVQASSVDPSTNTPSPERRLMRGLVRNAISGSWCAIGGYDFVRREMQKTRGVTDIAARLWIFEDDPDIPRVTPLGNGIPLASFLLQIILDDPDNHHGNRQVALDSIISAAGGDIGKVTQTSLVRLKNAFQAHTFSSSDSLDCTLVLPLVMRLCFSSNPEHFQAFLDHGVLPVCIKLLIRLASVMNSGSLTTKDQARIVMLMIQAFRFLQLCLQLPLNLPWVLQAIDSGLLTAFVECSPFYEDIKRDDYIMISATFSNTLPRYLTYSCVVRAMDAAFLQLEKTGRFLLLRKTRAWKSLDDLALLTARRHGVIGQLKCIKKNVSACFNPKCEKLDVRNHFRKCARCHTALYCSKECQVTHWKEFRHKQNCRLDTSDRDLEYIQVLNICEIRAHMQYIKSLAATEHPGVPVDDLVVVVDYSVVPTKYKLDLQSIWMRDHPNLFIVPTRKYLPDLTARSTTHIIGILPHQVEGIPKYLTTPVPRGIWNPLVDWVAKSGVDSIGSARWMEREAQARRKLYLDVRA